MPGPTIEDKIYNFMKVFSVHTAGPLIMKYQGRVKNIGKETDTKSPEAMAKTVVDEIIQELFLAELYRITPTVRINVEEETPLRYLFRYNSGMTVHVDPLDGTQSYVDGSDRFSTGYGISDKDNNFTHTVIFFPAENRLVCEAPNERHEHSRLPYSLMQRIIYEKRVLSERGINVLTKAGYTVKTPDCSHLCIADVALQVAGAYIYGGSNPHDSMIPYAFAKKCGARVVDDAGKDIIGAGMHVANDDGFCKFKRLPFVFYFSQGFKGQEEIFRILADQKNRLN